MEIQCHKFGEHERMNKLKVHSGGVDAKMIA